MCIVLCLYMWFVYTINCIRFMCAISLMTSIYGIIINIIYGLRTYLQAMLPAYFREHKFKHQYGHIHFGLLDIYMDDRVSTAEDNDDKEVCSCC